MTDPEDWSRAAARGVRLGLATGTTAFAEIVTNDPARGALSGCCAGGVEYLEVIGEVERSWAAGGRDLLSRHGTRVALCPRSNAVIGLAEAPVADYLHEGHEICVGTDSLASCPSLDLLADVAHLAAIARRQGYDGADLFARLLRAATLRGARALGIAEGHGTLVAGGPANLASFAVTVEADAERALVEQGEGACVLTILGGRIIHDQRQAGRS